MRGAIVLLAIITLPMAAAGQEPSGGGSPGVPRTRAEATEYVETSSYVDVLTFLDVIEEASPDVHVGSFGYSYEGRRLPLVVWGAPAATPEAARSTDKTRVLV
ncbi:MAG TPA: peptidase M14, partial [Gemmatimonadota bacterium]|nr:peptidase M14 [Gemmatimonadota bacterium]